MTALDILTRVSRTRGVSIVNLRGPGRWKSVARARHELAWLLRQHTAMSLTEIGKFLGGRHHTTILNSEEAIGLAIARDPEYRDEIEALVASVTFAEECLRRVVLEELEAA